ncbi:MAG: hypothetical protein RLZZ450_2622 [Pseudomonadota bacterium]|jgi:excisionase family DNA binding protein
MSEKKFEQVWFTTAEAAEYMRMTARAVQKQVERGHLQPDNRHVGRIAGFRFRRETLDRFITGK